MGKGARWVLLLALCAVLIGVSIHYPRYLSDSGNEFLHNFIGVNLLSVLGFITAVGNAATLSIFLHLNNLEDKTGFSPKRARKSLSLSAISLIIIFLAAFISVILKGAFAKSEVLHAVFNSFGIVTVFFSLSVLSDLTMTVFAIPTERNVKLRQQQNREREQSAPNSHAK